jgi:hypothetical protein
MQSSICYGLAIMGAMNTMKREQCSLELEATAFVACNPMTCYGEIPTTVTVGPKVSREADLTSCFLKKRSVMCNENLVGYTYCKVLLQADKPHLPCSNDSLMKLSVVRDILLLKVFPKQEQEITEFMALHDID